MSGKKKKEYDKQYRLQNIEKLKKYAKQWRIKNRKKARKYAKQYREGNKEKIKKGMAEYYQSHKEELNQKSIKSNKQRRLKVLNIISNDNPVCVRCGCNDIRLLEINHINGGGGKEQKSIGGNVVLYQNIINKTRKTDDLELLCRVCNAWHALELKYGELPYTISYDRRKENREQ